MGYQVPEGQYTVSMAYPVWMRENVKDFIKKLNKWARKWAHGKKLGWREEIFAIGTTPHPTNETAFLDSSHFLGGSGERDLYLYRRVDVKWATRKHIECVSKNVHGEWKDVESYPVHWVNTVQDLLVKENERKRGTRTRSHGQQPSDPAVDSLIAAGRTAEPKAREDLISGDTTVKDSWERIYLYRRMDLPG